MTKTYEKVSAISKIILIIVIVVLFVSLVICINSYIIDVETKYKPANEFCNINYPSNAKSIYENSLMTKYNFLEVEEGYIECCRFIYVEHKIEKECKVFKYN